jgi:hypothetical protein
VVLVRSDEQGLVDEVVDWLRKVDKGDTVPKPVRAIPTLAAFLVVDSADDLFADPPAGSPSTRTSWSPERPAPERRTSRVHSPSRRAAKGTARSIAAPLGFDAEYASVKRFARKLRGTQTPEERVVIETAPGREAQVDYGEGPMVRDPDTK